MKILALQETDYLTRGPHVQQHLFERLSKNHNFKIIVLDYDIDQLQKTQTKLIMTKCYENVSRVLDSSSVKVIRSFRIRVPFINRISSLISNFFEILKNIKNWRPDIIYGYSMTNGLIGFLLAKIYNIPYIFHYIDILHELVPISFVKGIARVIARFLLKHSDQIIVLNQIHKKYVINEGVNPKNVKILKTGVSLENTIVDKKKLLIIKQKYHIDDSDFVIFFMGYLYNFAGLKEIIDYYDHKVKNSEIRLRFIILGDGGIYSELKTYILKNNIDWVFMVGRVSYFEITEYIELSNLCLLSFEINKITQEISPIKIYEYMAQKKPTLCTKLPGVYNEIGENNGIIFSESQKELIREIGILSTQTEKLKVIGQNGYDYVQKNLLWDNIVLDLKKILRSNLYINRGVNK